MRANDGRQGMWAGLVNGRKAIQMETTTEGRDCLIDSTIIRQDKMSVQNWWRLWPAFVCKQKERRRRSSSESSTKGSVASNTLRYGRSSRLRLIVAGKKAIVRTDIV